MSSWNIFIDLLKGGKNVRKVIVLLMVLLFSSSAFAGDLELVGYKIGSDSLGYYVYGTIRNNSGGKCNSVCVDFSLYSSISKDKFLGSVSVCESGLKDGAQWSFKTTHIQTDTRASEVELNSLNCY